MTARSKCRGTRTKGCSHWWFQSGLITGVCRPFVAPAFRALRDSSAPRPAGEQHRKVHCSPQAQGKQPQSGVASQRVDANRCATLSTQAQPRPLASLPPACVARSAAAAAAPASAQHGGRPAEPRVRSRERGGRAGGSFEPDWPVPDCPRRPRNGRHQHVNTVTAPFCNRRQQRASGLLPSAAGCPCGGSCLARGA